MEKFAQFGVEPLLLVAQIVNFLLLLYLLKRFLYKPLLAMIKKREEKIQLGLEAGTRGEALLVKARQEERTILQKANEEANLLIGEAKQRAIKEAEEIVALARQNAEKTLLHTQGEIEQERKQAEKAFEDKIFQVAVTMVEKVLPKALTKDDHIRILEQSEKLLKKEVPS